MTYAAVAIGGANLIGGLVSSKSAKKLQKQALELQQQQLAFAKQRYDENKALYGGVRQQAVDDAMKGVTADLGGVTARATGDVAAAFKNAEETRLRNAQRLGINPNSGRAEAMASQAGIQQALAQAGNVTTQREAERKRAEDLTRTGRQWAANLGAAELNGSAAGVGDAGRQAAAGYGGAADQQAEAAGAFFQGAGALLGNAAANWKKPTEVVDPSAPRIPNYNVTPYESPVTKSAIKNNNLITDLTTTPTQPQATQYVYKGMQNIPLASKF